VGTGTSARTTVAGARNNACTCEQATRDFFNGVGIIFSWIWLFCYYISGIFYLSHPVVLFYYMRFSQLIAFVGFALLTMSNSCKKEEDVLPCASSLTVETAQVPGLKAHITEPIPNVGQSNEYIVNSASEYRELFDCSPPPMVDFMTHTLLAGKTKTATGSRVLSQEVVQTCIGYTYTVKLEAASSQKVGSVVYHVVIPKILPTAKVNFDVQLPSLAATSAGTASEL
jgi:hypothetical protein